MPEGSSMKTIAFKVPKSTSPDEWVRSAPVREETPASPDPTPAEEPIRFSMLMPRELHRRVKTQCAQRGVIIANVIRDFLEREFPA
jgi:hypothetical protein